MNTFHSALPLPRQEVPQEISCSGKNLSLSQEVRCKGQNWWVLFRLQYNEGDMVGCGTLQEHYRQLTHCLPELTVLELREKMRWLHQYSLEIEQHHNYQGPVVSV